jgi:hypothetical protein
MARRDPRVTAYIRNRAPFARPLLRQLRTRIHQAHPQLTETLKWGMPSFLFDDKIVCGIAGFKAHCALWFWEGREIVGAKPAGAMGNFGRITAREQLPSAARIKEYVRKRVGRISSSG